MADYKLSQTGALIQAVINKVYNWMTTKIQTDDIADNAISNVKLAPSVKRRVTSVDNLASKVYSLSGATISTDYSIIENTMLNGSTVGDKIVTTSNTSRNLGVLNVVSYGTLTINNYTTYTEPYEGIIVTDSDDIVLGIIKADAKGTFSGSVDLSQYVGCTKVYFQYATSIPPNVTFSGKGKIDAIDEEIDNANADIDALEGKDVVVDNKVNNVSTRVYALSGASIDTNYTVKENTVFYGSTIGSKIVTIENSARNLGILNVVSYGTLTINNISTFFEPYEGIILTDDDDIVLGIIKFDSKAQFSKTINLAEYVGCTKAYFQYATAYTPTISYDGNGSLNDINADIETIKDKQKTTGDKLYSLSGGMVDVDYTTEENTALYGSTVGNKIVTISNTSRNLGVLNIAYTGVLYIKNIATFFEPYEGIIITDKNNIVLGIIKFDSKAVFNKQIDLSQYVGCAKVYFQYAASYTPTVSYMAMADLPKSQYLDSANAFIAKNTAATMVTPNFTEAMTDISVSNITELKAAINQASSKAIRITLNSDIDFSGETISLSGLSHEVLINGNGHKITSTDATYSGEIVGGYKKCVYSSTIDNLSSFIADTGDILWLSLSDYYTAQSAITNEDGTALTETSTVCKFKLPSEFSTMTIAEGNDIYILITKLWMTAYRKVIKVTDGYVYYTAQPDDVDGFSGYTSDNADLENYGFNSRFAIVNYAKDGNSCYIDSGYLYYPAKYGSIKHLSENRLFELSNNTHQLGITNCSILVSQLMRNDDSIVNISNCTISGGNKYGIIIVGDNGILYFNNNNIFKTYSAVITDGVDRTPGKHDVYPINTLIAEYNEFTDTCMRFCGYGGIDFHGKALIRSNKFVDFGLSAIKVGIVSTDVSYGDNSVYVANNYIHCTDEFFKNAGRSIPCDQGAIYISPINTNCCIIGNIITRYRGRNGNKGIYFDEGCFNLVAMHNVIGYTPTDYSISCREGYNSSWRYYDNTLCDTNRWILYNIVSNGIWFAGSSRVSNPNCNLGYNIICTKAITYANKYNDYINKENPIMTTFADATTGIALASANMTSWDM